MMEATRDSSEDTGGKGVNQRSIKCMHCFLNSAFKVKLKTLWNAATATILGPRKGPVSASKRQLNH